MANEATRLETVSEGRRQKAFAAVKALGELRSDATGGETKVCQDCGGRGWNENIAGERRCTGPCHGSGRVPNDEATK